MLAESCFCICASAPLSNIISHACLQEHYCPEGVAVVNVTGRTWLSKYFEGMDYGIKDGKTDFIFVVKQLLDKILASLDPAAITGACMLTVIMVTASQGDACSMPYAVAGRGTLCSLKHDC